MAGRRSTADDYREHVRMVLRLCLRMLGNRADAEDAAHDAFERFLRGDFQGRSKVSTYLYSIATRVCLDRLRKIKRDERLYTEWRLRQESEGVPRAGRADNLLLAVQLLGHAEMTEETAEIAVSYYFHGMTEREIAKMIGLKRRTVSNRLATFRSLAKERLMDGGDDG